MSARSATTAVPPPHLPHDPSGLLVVAGADDICALCASLSTIIAASSARVIGCDVTALPATARSIEAVARLQLTAMRLDRRIRLQRASPQLRRLIEFSGLADVVPAG